MLSYFIICPLVFLAGFVDAIAGGGGLISLPAYMLSGLPPIHAIATNKMSSAMGTSLATYRYGRMGYLKWKLCLPCIFFALSGSFLGAKIALKIDDGIFRIILLVVLPLTALYVMRSRALMEEGKEALSFSKTLTISSAVSFIIGMYDGFYGPGTGTFLLLLLTGLAHLPVTTATGTTKVINLTTNITSLLVYLLHGKVLLPLGITAGLFNIAGNYLGTRCFKKQGVRIVKPIIFFVLVLFFIKTIFDLRG